MCAVVEIRLPAKGACLVVSDTTGKARHQTGLCGESEEWCERSTQSQRVSATGGQFGGG